MLRRTFVAGAAAGAAQFALGAPISARGIPPNSSRRAGFKLKYAPHFGMFKHHAGDDHVAQLQFVGIRRQEDLLVYIGIGVIGKVMPQHGDRNHQRNLPPAIGINQLRQALALGGDSESGNARAIAVAPRGPEPSASRRGCISELGVRQLTARRREAR